MTNGETNDPLRTKHYENEGAAAPRDVDLAARFQRELRISSVTAELAKLPENERADVLARLRGAALYRPGGNDARRVLVTTSIAELLAHDGGHLLFPAVLAGLAGANLEGAARKIAAELARDLADAAGPVDAPPETLPERRGDAEAP